MKFRLKCADALKNLSKWIRYLDIVILKPEDIVECIHRYYKEDAGNLFSADTGLCDIEEETLRKLCSRPGELLLLGCGSGRESFPLAERGYRVTGVDMVAELIEMAREEAVRRRLNIEFICRRFENLALDRDRFDYALYTLWLYEQIPGRKSRISLLRYLKNILRPGGRVIFHVHVTQPPSWEKRMYPLHKAVAFLSCGNTQLQIGDRLSDSIGFVHNFSSFEEVFDEMKEAGFTAIKNSPLNNGGLFCVAGIT